MKQHDLKIWAKFFAPVLSGAKKFEYRKNDRDYQVGDTLCLSEVIDEDTDHYTGRRLYVYVTYITYLPDNWAILSIDPQDKCS